ncbi:YegS/Rv2252/BmrU family lipid kinase [Merismopedia glauca]|uniref:Lipid kinase n=1 Tax=Merismopedia glauca CCAP 1448/3 TaxID=1296344 RepID=A0A2T1C319_9CYAN|nr:YegS/Rv2252/BmrU family lipid kinase [Merismopedia glauca]PSB02661.1 lipid kinase [Merismopedia glauca CCAP 1448/3]
MERSACLIFNPASGQGEPETELKIIRSILEPNMALDIRLTTPDLDADCLAEEAIRQGAKAIIASGGDGTISAASGALIGTGIPLGIISRGTANAFATALELPTTLEGACQTIVNGFTRNVDAAYCNDKPMVLLAGIGFEAQTIDLADRDTKDRLGILAYIFAGLQELRNLSNFETEIETEEKIVKVTAAAVTVANAAPATSILAQGPAGVIANDGLLDMTIVSPSSMTGAIAASYHLLRTALQGEASERQDIGYLRSKYFKVATTPPQKVVVDGEIIGTTPIEVRCIPGGLIVFSPQFEPTQPVEKLEGLPNLVVELKNPENLDAD